MWDTIKRITSLFSRRERLSRKLISRVKFPQGNCLLVRDADGRVLLCNATLRQVFAIRYQEQPLAQVEAYFDPVVASIIRSTDEAALRSRTVAMAHLPAECAPGYPDGMFKISTTPLYGDDGKFQGFVSVLTDQRELHLAELAANEANQRVRSLLDAMPMPAAVFEVVQGSAGTLDLILKEMNIAGTRLAGARELPFGRSGAEFWPLFRKTELLQRVAQTVQGGEPFSIEAFSSVFGRQIELFFRPYEHNSVLVFLQDLTELRHSEEQVIRLTHQLRVTQAEHHYRQAALVEDSTHFMRQVVERLADQLESLDDLTNKLEPGDKIRVMQSVGKIRGVNDKMLRYASVGFLPDNPELLDLRQLFGEMTVGLAAKFPHIEFSCHNLPRMVMSRDAVSVTVRSLIELVCTSSLTGAVPCVVIQTVADFAETTVAVDFHGFNLSVFEFMIDEDGEVEAGWDLFGSLRLASVRRVLTLFNRKLFIQRLPDSDGLRFVMRQAQFHVLTPALKAS